MTSDQNRSQSRDENNDDEDPSSSLSHFFERVDDPNELTPDDFLDRFERFGFLWFRGSNTTIENNSCNNSNSNNNNNNGGAGGGGSKIAMPTGTELLEFVRDHSSACETSWTFENDGTLTPAKKSERATPNDLHGFTGTEESFYVSTIVHRKLTLPPLRIVNYYDDEEECDDEEDRETKKTAGGSDCCDDDGDGDNGDDFQSRFKKKAAATAAAHEALMKLLPRFDNVFEDIYEIGDPSGTWLFIGHHGVSVSDSVSDYDYDSTVLPTDRSNDGGNTAPAAAAAAASTKKRKRKRERPSRRDAAAATAAAAAAIPIATKRLAGRAEHVDDVTHSGTYHIQIAGTKTWKIRPHPDSSLAEELLLNNDDDDDDDNNNNKNKNNDDDDDDDVNNTKNKSWKLEITVEEGDVFVLNTKTWYHCTELDPAAPTTSSSSSSSSSSLPPSHSEWSISAAQDFYLPVPCPRDVAKADVVYGYDPVCDPFYADPEDLEIPNELPRSDTPNCALFDLGNGDDDYNNDDDDDDYDDGMKNIALVALRDIPQGESLTVAFDDADDQLGNSKDRIDPRLIARKPWREHQIVIRGEHRIPIEIPRSYEPNCEIIYEKVRGGDLALRALTYIPVGGVFCVMPDAHEEYEEVEVDLETGELVLLCSKTD